MPASTNLAGKSLLCWFLSWWSKHSNSQPFAGSCRNWQTVFVHARNMDEVSQMYKNRVISSLANGDTPDSAVPKPAKKPSRLVVHFDINETILLGDPAGGDSPEDSLHKMMAKSAFVKIPDQDRHVQDSHEIVPTHWWTGQPLDDTPRNVHKDHQQADTTDAVDDAASLPPLYTGWTWPADCVPYYRTAYKKRAKTFCDHHGQIYRDVFDICRNQLVEESRKNVNEAFILPAFYKTLEYLHSHGEEQPFSVVLRTFGDDLPQMVTHVNRFAQGKHPDYPHIQDKSLELTHLYQGRWKDGASEQEPPTYQLWNMEETQLVAEGDSEILSLLDQHTMCGIRDDYHFWNAHDCRPTSGKPVWLPHYDSAPWEHHLLFDDNIHNVPQDCIACIRQQKASHGAFLTVEPEVMLSTMHGTHVIRTPTIEPVLKTSWFVEKIREAQARVGTLDIND